VPTAFRDVLEEVFKKTEQETAHPEIPRHTIKDLGMARKPKEPKADKSPSSVTDYRYEDKRKNNPPAKIAAEGFVPLVPKAEYLYSPRRPPELRFDPTGAADELPELLAKATREPLTADEAKVLAEALRINEPWLEWAGKREQKSFTVDPVALQIHERVSAQAILKVAAREDVNRSLFADPEQEYNEAVQFYKHDVDWSNRLILGDSLQVMSSLALREDLAGKVQMIYVDPPYGIKFGSNFQPEVGKTVIGDKEKDLTRELETVKAYRDTWNLGLHSYLAYLRDRLTISKELLTDGGSIFVQISDENLHVVRNLLDEIFGHQNFIVLFTFTKKGSQSGDFVPPINEYVVWYAKNRNAALTNFNPLYEYRDPCNAEGFAYAELNSGEVLPVSSLLERGAASKDFRLFSSNALFSQKPGPNQPVMLRGQDFPSGGNSWKIAAGRIPMLDRVDRLLFTDNRVRYKRFADDFPAVSISNVWTDLAGSPDKRYVVQTNPRIIERCMLLTTKPGDLVLDPTCGSGTTAAVAEQWGRRWITSDTSRVAIAIARQRLLTAKFEYFKLTNEEQGIAGNFRYKIVPHITLKSIAQNTNLDPIFTKHQIILDAALVDANTALANVPDKARVSLQMKLAAKQKAEGKKSITDADRRRWELPAKPKKWQHWQVPFDSDPDYPHALSKTVEEYRKAWRAKMHEINTCISANAEPETLIDQPEVDRKITRVSGPFTVEAVQPPELSLGDAVEVDTSDFGGEPEALNEAFALGEKLTIREVRSGESPQNVEAYLSKMIDLLRMDGVRFPDNKHLKFTRLEAIYATGKSSGIHAEGRWSNSGETDPEPDGPATVGIVFGPQYGPITAKMIEEVIKPAARRYDDLVFAGFSFDGPAQAVIDEGVPRLRLHLAHIRPDVNPGMNGLLKEQPGSQLFTVFGRPRTELSGPDPDGMFTIEMQGVDVYDPVTNNIIDTGATKVAAWFLDSDYDNRTFCITQAFFPDRSAWEKLSKALDGIVDPERFEALSGTTSLPFAAGEHKSAAVKVIDPRGNEVMRVHSLTGAGK
jgi:adenine-specific DNA-methyltransferase